MTQTLVAIFVGGGLGSLARFGVSKAVLRFFDGAFPLGTFCANILSCVVMALALAWFSKENTSDSMKALVLIGFCGGFSTFSTFSFETIQLIKDDYFWLAAVNVLMSVAVCLAVLYVLIPKT